MKAAGYIRVSTQEQADKGWNLGEDRKLIVERCAREGWELVAIHDDGGRQGDDPDRPGLRALIDSLGDLDVVIMRSQDRISRDIGIWAVTSAALRAAGVRVETFTGSIDLESPAGEFMANVMASVGKFEKRQTGERVRQALGARARAGRYVGGRSYGYRSEAGSLVVEPAEAAIVRRIFAEFVAGKPKATIARGLEAEHAPTRTGGHWYASTIVGILKNPLYVGLVTHRAETFPGTHEPIIDRKMWDAAQQLQEGREAHGGRPRGRPATGAHLLTEGLLVCSCGSRMTPETRRYPDRVYEVYRCARAKVHDGGCEQKPIRRAVVDRAVWAFFEQVALDEDATRQTFRAHSTYELDQAVALMAQSEGELVRADARLAKITRGWQDEIIGDAEYAAQRGDLLAQRQAAEAQVEMLRARRRQLEDAIEALDVELEIAKQLTAMRRLAAGEIADAQTLQGQRAVLRRLFVGFSLMSPKELFPAFLGGQPWDRWLDVGAEVERPSGRRRWRNGYALMPWVRADAAFVAPPGSEDLLGIQKVALALSSIYSQTTGAVTEL